MERGGRGKALTGTRALGVAHEVSTRARYEVSVSDDQVLVDVRARRADVVGRLLDLGVSPRTLTTLLPEWEELIATVVTARVE